jgi:hypothetical protein
MFRLPLHPRLGAASALLVAAAGAASAAPLGAQQWLDTTARAERTNRSAFRALEELPPANQARSASGAPGPRYWQQRVDYVIRAALDTVQQAVTGSERITYHNNSPDTLRFLWFQLDQNIDQPTSRANLATPAPAPGTKLSPAAQRLLAAEPFQGGYTLSRVQTVSAAGARQDARRVVNNTMMRVDLAAPLAPGRTAVVEIDWRFLVPEGGQNGRGAKEKVKDGWLYEIAQWFPRAAVYDDANGWQTDQFLGQGEFYLNFGDYDVSLTVPRDHLVSATGTLQNPAQVLTATQRARLAQALRDTAPVFVVRPDEVGTAASRPAGTGMLTWRFTAENVRDFAWVSSRAYVWDAAGFRYPKGGATDGRLVELHSLYPREAMPLWDKVSTRAIAQTMRTYGRMAFEYPYPKAVNVHGPVFGMEYPMIAFCGARPNADGTYSDATERALVSVTIHEVGHNWFPMIVASDERKWTWMDEGLNSFVQYYAEQEWQPGYASRRGPARNIVAYMQDSAQVPLMTESNDVQANFGNNGYSKPAAGLVLLRERVLGDSLFDAAFREYAQRWMFKHPQPADFFRTMDDGAGENLSYFWRGWFYTTHANDQAVANVESQAADSLVGSTARGKRYVRVTLENRGGLVLPVELALTFADGSTRRVKLPVDVWRRNERRFEYGFFSDADVVGVVVDPDEGFADVNRANNAWGRPAKPIS